MSTPFLPLLLANKHVIFDTTIGYLTHTLRMQGREQGAIYLSLRDSGELGSQGLESLASQLHDLLLALHRAGCRQVTSMCNTAEGVIEKFGLRQAFSDMTIRGPVLPVLHSIVERGAWHPKKGSVVLLGSPALSQTGVYQERLKQMELPFIFIEDRVFISEIGNGLRRGIAERLIAHVKEVCGNTDIACLALACTAYSLIADEVQQLAAFPVVDSGTLLADQVIQLDGGFKEAAEFFPSPAQVSQFYLVQGSPERLQTVIRQLTGLEVAVKPASEIMHVASRDFPRLTKEDFLRLLGDSAALIEWLSHPKGMERIAEFLPWWPELCRLEQNVPHHIENVGQHSTSLIRVDAASVDPIDTAILNLCKITHDAGKLETWRACRRFKGHEAVSAKLLGPLAESLGFTQDEIDDMCFAVAEHMHAHYIQSLPESDILRIRTHRAYELWRRLCLADEKSRGSLWNPESWERRMQRIEGLYQEHMKSRDAAQKHLRHPQLRAWRWSRKNWAGNGRAITGRFPRRGRAHGRIRQGKP